MIQPTDKYIMQDYRASLGTNDAPQMINTENPITPVAVINNGLRTPKSNQSIKLYSLSKGAGTDSTVQISTVSSSKRVFILGYTSLRQGVDTTFTVKDLSSGAGIGIADADTDTFLFMTGIGHLTHYNFPIPLECKQGIRLRAVSSGATLPIIVIHFMEEDRN